MRGRTEPVANWPQPLGHAGYTWGSMGGVFAETPDRVFLLQRGELPMPPKPFEGYPMASPATSGQPRLQNCILIVNREGKVVETWTQHDHLFQGGRGPHKVKISPYDPEKHVWIIDDLREQVFEFTHDGKQLVMTLGEAGVAGDDAKHFAGPTDIAWLPDGTFFVTDGYVNTRVVKFDKTGKFVKTWGGKGGGPGQFNLPHSIDIDRNRRLYVADRQNGRVQVFDEQGTFLDEWDNIVQPFHLIVSPDQHVWVSDGVTEQVPAIHDRGPSGVVVGHIRLDARRVFRRPSILGRFGGQCVRSRGVRRPRTEARAAQRRRQIAADAADEERHVRPRHESTMSAPVTTAGQEPVADTTSFLDPRIDRTSIAPDSPVPADDLARWYRAMRLARTFEDKLAALYRQGKIVGAVYLGTGQEAISTGVVSLLQKEDYFSTVARGLAGWFLRGVEPRDVMGRWFGKDIPPSHGRELGLFLADTAAYGIAPYHNGSMASWIPSGAGFALAFKYRKEPRVYVALTGDGATSPGDFYEGLNFAAIHKLPLVIVVENNCYAYSTPQSLQMPVANVADRAPAFNIPASIGFGNDIFEVRRLVGEAIDHARSGKGPVPGRVQDVPAARPWRARRYGLRAGRAARVLGAPRSDRHASQLSASTARAGRWKRSRRSTPSARPRSSAPSKRRRRFPIRTRTQCPGGSLPTECIASRDDGDWGRAVAWS